MDVKGEVLLELFNKSKFLRNGTKAFPQSRAKFFSINSHIYEIRV